MQVLDKIEIAILQQTINKYYPGVASFALQSFISAPVVQGPAIRTNSVNKNNTFSTRNVSISSSIALYVPKSVTIGYKSKYIPSGTKFIVGFAGEDRTKPMILGMKLD